jgi:hypothetical protein
VSTFIWPGVVNQLKIGNRVTDKSQQVEKAQPVRVQIMRHGYFMHNRPHDKVRE